MISESLERGLSDDVLKSKVYFGLFSKITMYYSPWYFPENRKLGPVQNLGFEHTI